MLFTKRELNNRAKEIYRTTEDFEKHILYSNEFYETLKTLGGEIFDDTKDEELPEMAFLKQCLPNDRDDKTIELARYCLGLGAQTLCNEKRDSLKEVFNAEQYEMRKKILQKIEEDEDKTEISEACFRSAYNDFRKAGHIDDVDLLWEYYCEDVIDNCDHSDYEVVEDEDPRTGNSYTYVKCPVCGKIGHRNVYQTEDGHDEDIEWE